MAQFSVEIMRLIGSVLGGNQQLPIKQIVSEVGEPYLGIPIDSALVTSYRRKLSHRLGHQTFNIAINRREKRDGLSHHITIITPTEFTKLNREQIGTLEGTNVEFAMTGLGHITQDSANAYFVTVQSPHAALLRSRVGLKPHDFHITLGFDPHDIHGMPKGEETWMI